MMVILTLEDYAVIVPGEKDEYAKSEGAKGRKRADASKEGLSNGSMA